MTKMWGPYHIQEEIGRGGMATIYRAYDTRLDRWVALKVLPAYFQHNREFVTRFQREARNAAALGHPHIVPIFESGELEGQPYIAMAWADAGSLSDLLDRQRGPLPPAQVADIMSQVASALDHAHRHGVIHRDIKPANILLTRQGHAMLTDFGIARAAWESRLTGSGVRLGTPAYMAPEQARGRAVDRRTDLYALGVVLYEMLTGAPPFQGDTDAVLYQHVHEPPPPPRQRNPALPPALDKVLARALAKDPQKRYRSAGELVAALCSALPGTGPRGSAPTPQHQGRDVGPVPTLLALLGVAVMVTALVLVGLGLFESSANPSSLPGPIVTLPNGTPTPNLTATLTPTPSTAAPLPDRPLAPVTPGEGASILVGRPLTLSWEWRDLGDKERFRVQLRRDGQALPLPNDGVTRAFALPLPPDGLTPGDYRWWVTVEKEDEGRWEPVERTGPAGWAFAILRPTPVPPTATPALPAETPFFTPTPPAPPPPQCREVCDTCERTVQDPVTGEVKTETYPCNCRTVCD